MDGVTYIAPIFKQYGLSDKEEFSYDELMALMNKYPKINQLNDAQQQLASLQQQLAYLNSLASTTDIENQKTAVNNQIAATNSTINSLKAEMGMS